MVDDPESSGTATRQRIVDEVMHTIAMRHGSSTRRDFEVACLTVDLLTRVQQAQERTTKEDVLTRIGQPASTPDPQHASANEKDCSSGRHHWPPSYDSGDTCECGSFYLTSLPDGTMELDYVPSLEGSER